MKKLILITLILSALFSCKNKPIQISAREGQFIDSLRIAYSPTKATKLEIRLLDDTFYIYRKSVDRIPTDSTGSYSNTDSAGTWVQVDESHFTFTPNTNRIVINIPFNPIKPVQQMNGIWSDCCECPQMDKCCMSWPTGNGYTCTGCPRWTCNYCVSMNRDYSGANFGASYVFTFDGLTATNFKVINE